MIHSDLVPDFGVPSALIRTQEFLAGGGTADARIRSLEMAHNLRPQHSTLRRRSVREVLITDVDNTLYDFGTYFEAGLRGLVPVAATILGQSERYILNTLKTVFTARGSLEFPFPLADFPDIKDMSADERLELLRTTSLAFWAEAAVVLTPYPGVLATLRQLRREGVAVVAFTDAPFHEAARRLRALGIDHYLSGFVATQWFIRRQRGTPAVRITEIPGFVRARRSLTVVRRLTDSERKPNPKTYLEIMRSFNLTPDRVTVIGDSPARDLAPADAVGMRAIWARYGRRNPSAEVMLQQIVPFRLPEITVAQDTEAQSFPAVDSFDEILKFLPTQQILQLRYR